jgi:UPF0755 protein
MAEPVSNESPPKRRWTFWRVLVSLFLYLWVLLLLGLAGAGVAAFIVYEQVIQPGTPGPKVQVTVPEGATGRDIGRLLTEKGVIEHEGFFRLAIEIDGTDRAIRHGEYEVPKGLSALEVLRVMYEGPPMSLNANRHQVTVPEGLTIAQAAALFDNPQAFIEAASDPEIVARAGISTATLEGFLMPNTYYFDKPPTERQAVERMVEQFEKEWNKLVAGIPGAENFDKLAVVTIASLVEEEARVESERPLVAAVLYNRIAKKMPLQMDSTLQYALGKYGQRLLYTDRDVDSPYNTYRNTGLPPGPISSPGVSCLAAALAPAKVDYLFFVSNADGKSHTFSSTMAEHERAVARFRRDIAPQRREIRSPAP